MPRHGELHRRHGAHGLQQFRLERWRTIARHRELSGNLLDEYGTVLPRIYSHREGPLTQPKRIANIDGLAASDAHTTQATVVKGIVNGT